MTTFQAGFGRSDITPRLGCQLVGYNHRPGGASGVHDALQARALVLEHDGARWAVVSCDLCFVGKPTVDAIREAVAARTGIAPDAVFVAATHTHSGPDDLEAGAWERPLAELVADAVVAADAARQPARLGGGFGMLYGYSINRRWLDRPVDPGVGVVRIDDAQGNPLGLLTNFACHAVVMGSDNLLISGDWPGQACRDLEAALGPQSTCLFLSGGSGDINPLVANVRARLERGQPVRSIGNISTYYGAAGDPQLWNIGDRGGGTFAEVAELAAAFSAEVLRVAHGIRTQPVRALWSEQVMVDALRSADEPALHLPRPFDALDVTTLLDAAGRMPAEIMLLGMDDILLLGEPGEVFSETAVRFRTHLRLLGYTIPMLVGYANGRLDYLPEAEAFDEGGYEPIYPAYMGISRYFQDRVWRAVEPVVRQHAPPVAEG